MSTSDSRTEVTSTVISAVYQGTIKPAVLVRLAVRCALVALLCATTFGMARVGAGRPGNRPATLGVVRQAHVEPRAITLPVVDGKGIRFTRLSTDEGLSQTKVSQILQDDQGFMWFGTQYGLNRYDGYQFRVFTPEFGRSNSLSGAYIYSLFRDRSGVLWIGCDLFLDRFDPVTETFTHLSLENEDLNPIPARVVHISQDRNGTLWLATGKGLYGLDPETGRIIHHYLHDPLNPSSLSSNDVKSTGEDRNGMLWVADGNDLERFDDA